MALLDQDTREAIRKYLLGMETPVKLIVITDNRSPNCEYCNDIKALFTELSELKLDKLQIELVDGWREEFNNKYGVKFEHIPAIIFENQNVKGTIVYRGIPADQEFGVFLETILELSLGHIHLRKEDVERINKISKKVNIYVYVTPSCPYCPAAVASAYSIAMLNPNITAHAIESIEFQSESNENKIRAVPTVIISTDDKKVRFEGALPIDVFLNKIESVL